MRLITREQAQKVDARAQSEYGLSSADLMENAGEAVVTEICKTWKAAKAAILVAGRGNNGADAWVVARQLKEIGFSEVTLIHLPQTQSHVLWDEKRKRALAGGVREVVVGQVEDIPPSLHGDVLVDGLYGTGLTRKSEGEEIRLIQWLNAQPTPRVSIDLPSGLDCNTGEIWGDCVTADLTVTFGLCKPGLLLNYGPRFSGRVVCRQIGFPEELLRDQANDAFAVGLATASRWLPARPNVSNKGTFGRVVLFAGSEKFRGAGLLAAQAAMRSGAGYVHMVADDAVFPEMLQLPELIYHTEKNIPWSQFDASTVFVLGPGWSVGERIREVITELEKRKFPKVLLDAEAINELSYEKAWHLPKTWLMTPHPGELGRLLKKNTEVIVSDRMRAVAEASDQWQCRFLLKGFRTIVGDRHRRVVVIAGNSALAKAGSGDVLAGVIAAFSAQGLDLFRAGILGASIHGSIANRWVASGRDPASLMPQDLLHALPRTLRRARELKLASSLSHG